MNELLGMQLETIEAIIVALGTSFVGTGTVAMIVKVALNKTTNTLKEKVLLAENENKLSKEQANKTIQSMHALETILKSQIDTLNNEIVKLIEDQQKYNKNVQDLLDEYRVRDEQIASLIEEELGDDIE